jgi:hypothetical protein
VVRDDNLRVEVAEQLTTRSAAGGPLHQDAAECTQRRYATDISRAVLYKHIVDRYLARENPRRDGRSAIVTVGAPGSGKSSMLRARIADLDDYRVIDADIINLIEKALDDGIYDHVDSAYTDIEVYGLDIGLAAAHEQALARWWQGRLDWINGADQLQNPPVTRRRPRMVRSSR